MQGVAYSVGERVLLMRLHEQGRSLKTLSRETKVPRQILSEWWKRYQQAGAEDCAPTRGDRCGLRDESPRGWSDASCRFGVRGWDQRASRWKPG